MQKQNIYTNVLLSARVRNELITKSNPRGHYQGRKPIVFSCWV